MNENPVLTIRDLGLDISVWFDRYDGDRCQYGYRIADKSAIPTDPNGGVLAEGTDLRSPGEPDLCDALRTLLVFLAAAVESYDHAGIDGENARLFPEELLSVLSHCSDDVSYTASWLGEDA